jgi:potassium/hydrogen antiporter
MACNRRDCAACGRWSRHSGQHVDPVVKTLVVIGGLLIVGAVGEFVFARTRVPDLIWLVGAGILAGPVFNLVSPELLQPGIPIFGAIALTIILSGAAIRLRLSDVIGAAPRGLTLGLAGFICSVTAVCAFFWLATVLEFMKPAPVLGWVLAGVIVGGTSSIVIMPTVAMSKVPGRVARLIEVESAATDALTVVVAMVLIDIIASGDTDISRPFASLGRELGIGVGLGVVAAAMIIPGIRVMRNKPHGYTLLLALMLGLYAVSQSLHGNGAMAVLLASLLIGNASSIVPRLFPGALGQDFTASETTKVMQDQMTFLIKSFFFFLIGLMFPTNFRLIILAAVATSFLFAMRIPAVMIATLNLRLGRKEFWLLNAAMPRGLAAGVVATLPMRFGLPSAENFAPAVFALIVFSVFIFAILFAVVGRLPDEPQPGRADTNDRR